MRHEAHVRLVDAHAEGDGRAHDDAVLAQEAALVVGTHFRRQAGVVGQGIEALVAEEFGGFLDLAPRHAVDDAGLAAVAAQEIGQLLAGIVFLHHGVADVGAVERADEVAGLGQVQALGDLALGGRVGGGGQRDARNVRPALVQDGQLAVFGAEIVAPLRHAVRFVDGEQGDVAAREQRQKAAGQQALGSDIEHVQLAGQQLALDAGGGFAIQGRVQVFGAHAELAQGLDLVLHESDERGDDDADAIAQQCRDLVAQRLAAAGGHEDECVMSGSHVLHDVLLGTTEIVVTKDALEQIVRGTGSHPASLPPGGGGRAAPCTCRSLQARARSKATAGSGGLLVGRGGVGWQDTP